MARRIRPIPLDVTLAFGNEPDQARLVLDNLRTRGLYKPDLIYHGFDGDKELANMLREGVKDAGADTFYGAEEKRLFEFDAENPLDYSFCDSHVKAGLAVYDGDFVRMRRGTIVYEFFNTNRKLDALIAIYILKDDNFKN